MAVLLENPKVINNDLDTWKVKYFWTYLKKYHEATISLCHCDSHIVIMF